MEVLGYADKLSVRAGERIQFMVSSERDRFRADIVKLDRAFSLAPGDVYAPPIVESPVSGEHPGVSKPIHAGSYVTVPRDGLDFTAGVTLHVGLYPTLPVRGREQGIVSRWSAESGIGFTLALDAEGHLIWRTGDGARESVVRTPEALADKRWYQVAAMFNPATGESHLYWNEQPRGWVKGKLTGGAIEPGVFADAAGALLLGASWLEGDHAVGHFNGKVDRPAIWARALSDDEFIAFGGGAPATSIPDLIADWDPVEEYRSRRLVDTAPTQRHGTLVNLPVRLVTGANWTGEQVNFQSVPDQYGAIHFHEDELEDAKWAVDFTYDAPPDLPSGIYAARLEAGDTVDYVPFYVRPATPEQSADILFLGPTNTYLAYGNEKLFSMLDTDPIMTAKMTSREVTLTSREEYMRSRPEIAASTYDYHADGTGFCYSTRLRPVLTMRPDFINWMTGELRHFSADLYLVEWLAQQGFAFDVASDEDLHMDGVDALSPYKVIVTGGHPEYWTAPMMDALEAYLANGGRMLYLGGNGFYWVTGIDRDYPHLVEVRRGYNGTRSWESAPGEVYQTTSGQPGGLWRYRGRNPNKLTGIGFTAQGWGGAAGFVRLEESNDPRAAWIFDGVGQDEVIGEFGHVMNGAAGDEIDRYDLAFGTPPETLRLATSQGRQSNYYQLVLEDQNFGLAGQGGQEEPRVRSDITLLEMPGGGAVFSAGSITWNCSLTVNDGDNNVSRITANVLRRFADG
jgi:N,N-dimethylformamidase